jgi:hypothetical protein
VSFFVLVTPASTPPTPTVPRDLTLALESWDGSRSLSLSDGPVRWKAGATGLEVAPSDILGSATPGVAGMSMSGVSYPARPVLLPLTIAGSGWPGLHEALESLRDITDPARGLTPDGSFRLVATTPAGTRRLGLVYRSGLEGLGVASHVRQNVVLDLLAPQPFAEDRDTQSRPFQLAAPDRPFLTTPGAPNVWGSLSLVSSRIAGPDTPVVMASTVPVFPTFTITGPADSVLITGTNGLRLDVPAGLEAGQVLEVVSSSRGKSVRLDGELAASALARGSRLAPFGLGTTVLSVSAPGATGDTRLVVSWRGLHRSLL